MDFPTSEASLNHAALEWFCVTGHAAEDTSGDFTFWGRAPDITAISPSGELITVEGKLHNWRRALTQANEHRICADLSFVLMPRIPRTLHLTAFRELGVGFILWTHQHGFRVILRPRRQPSPARAPIASFLHRHWPEKFKDHATDL